MKKILFVIGVMFCTQSVFAKADLIGSYRCSAGYVLKIERPVYYERFAAKIVGAKTTSVILDFEYNDAYAGSVHSGTLDTTTYRFLGTFSMNPGRSLPFTFDFDGSTLECTEKL